MHPSSGKEEASKNDWSKRRQRGVIEYDGCMMRSIGMRSIGRSVEDDGCERGTKMMGSSKTRGVIGQRDEGEFGSLNMPEG